MLQQLTELRARAVAGTSDSDNLVRLDGQLTGALRTVFAMAENYPQLQASENFLQLQGALNETVNGAWDATKAIIIGADWTKFVCGIRRDMTYQVFDQGVITDDAGAVIVNLMQQDMVALRVTFRVGFACAVPKTQLGTDTSFPAGAVIPAAGATRSAKATKVEA